MAKKPTTTKRKKPTATKKRRKKSSSFLGRHKAKFISLLLLFSLAGAVYLVYLDQTVKIKFEGKRWAIPARIYGRALELYPGAHVSQKQFLAELKQLGYRRVASSNKSGTWSQNGRRIEVRTRDFGFWDGKQLGRYLDLRFSASGSTLAAIKDDAGRDVSLVRMEAPEIGSIHPTHNEDRVLVKSSELPKALVRTLIEIEDRDFFDHHGVDPKAILRAIWVNITAGKMVQGGSTLTQQLVKNFYLTSERTLKRKLIEAGMALVLDARYDKEDILEAYSNEIYLGQDGNRAIHGFGLASHFYFNRPLNELDLPKLALMVGLVRGPSYYDPRRHPERAKQRRDLVINVLYKRGAITQKQRDAALRSSLGVTSKGNKPSGRYYAFLDLVRRQLQRDYKDEDLSSEGLRIFSTIDPWAQQQAEEAISGRLSILEKSHRLPRDKLEAAAIIADVEGGEVLAIVGGRDSRYAGFNRALDAVRPIGSLVKPAIYLTALNYGGSYTVTTMLEDAPISVTTPGGKVWQPSNYDGTSHGEVPLYEALAKSYNLASVRLGMDLGLKRVADTIKALGIERKFDVFPSMFLGALSVSPIEMTQFYQTLAAGGFRSPLRAIREVLTPDGRTLQRYPLTVKQAVAPEPAYLLNWSLQQVVKQGTGQRLAKYISADKNIAGKTGTTNNMRDSWFAGYSADKVAVVWVGRDDNKPAKLTGSSGALEVWGDMMGRLPLVSGNRVQPEQVVQVLLDRENLLLADQNCSNTEIYPFIMGTEPAQSSPCVDGGFGGFLRGLLR